jgi:hypothetical protein
MTRPASSRAYSSFYEELVKAFNEDSTKPIFIPFDSLKKARNFRLEFYSFRAAFNKDNATGLYPDLMKMQVSLSDTPIGAEVSNRDLVGAGAAINAALAARQAEKDQGDSK